jgi:AraC-like DNA-binding protein
MTKRKIDEYHLHKDQPERRQFEIFSLQDYVEKHFEHSSKPHLHSFFQIIWFTKGNGNHFVDFKEYEVKPNTIFFINKSQVHYFDSSKNYDGILLHFNESFLVQHENDIDIFLKYNIFNNQHYQPFCSIAKQTADLLNTIILQIKDELNKQNPFGHRELLRHFLKAFLIQIERQKRDNNDTQLITTNEKHIQFLRFIELVELNYKKGFSVSEYATLLNISTKTLTDLTNKIVFRTPSLLIHERVILEAQRLLSHSSLNVNQIGYQLGFDDPSYFVKYFKKHTNSSPTDFRKSIS